MILHDHDRARPNLAGLVSPVQQAEMKILLAGRWPALKPLPVFKYETAEYRAAIDFDKLRGEWVCRKISFPSNNLQELRGGLTELTMALPHGQAEVFPECAAAEQSEQELERDARRRLQAILDWRANFESGAFYSELQNYLSKSQQEEIDDCIRLTLTARQLQVNPKNIAYVFDALSKAGGKLATLLEIAQRNKTDHGEDVPAKAEAAVGVEHVVPIEAIHPARERRLQLRTTPASPACVELGGTHGGTVLNISETGMAVAAAEPLVVDAFLPRLRFQLPGSGQSIEISAQIVWLAESKKSAGMRFVDLTAEARHQISNWIASEKPASEFAGLAPAPVENIIPATLESSTDAPIASVFLEQTRPSSPERIAHIASQAAKISTPELLEADPSSFVEDLQKKARHHPPVAGFGPQVRTGNVASSADHLKNSPSRLYVLEISGFQVAAVVCLFVAISLAVVITVGSRPLGERLRDTWNLKPAADAMSPALVNHPGETTKRASNPLAANTFLTPAPDPPGTASAGSRSESSSAQSLNPRPEDSATRVGPNQPSSEITLRSLTDSATPEVSPERSGSSGVIARNAPPPAHSPPRRASKAGGPISGVPANPVSRRSALATRAATRLSSPSTILVTGPGDGSKPFRLTLPEKSIAASSSFAMTSQLSVLVSPGAGAAPAQKSARLQAGELVSFVWPRYPRPGDRHTSSETVKVRTIIGPSGQVLDVKLVSGSTSLLPAATSAIRQWRYKPTLLNSGPVQTQQDVTIEFRPPQHLSQLRTRHP